MLLLVALPALGGCSQAFWDRSPGPRVQGIFVAGPLADVNDPAAVWKNPVLTGDPDGGAANPTRDLPMPSQQDLGVLSEVNRVRAQHGLAPLRYESRLFAAAYAHSLEQMRDGYLGHESRTATRATLGQRMQLEGYVGRTYAEVVAKDYPDARSVVAAWMDSPRHREVLLDPDLSEAGFSRVDGPTASTNRWTGDFADPGRSYSPIPTQPKTPAVAAIPQVPSPATRVSLPPTPAPRSGVQPPAYPAVPQPVANTPRLPSAPTSSAPTSMAPAMAYPPPVAPRMPTPVPPAPPVAKTDGNVVPPPMGARVAPPPAPYVPRLAQPSAPLRGNPVPPTPYVASAPRAVQPYIPPVPVQPYRPAAQPRKTNGRTKDCAT